MKRISKLTTLAAISLSLLCCAFHSSHASSTDLAPPTGAASGSPPKTLPWQQEYNSGIDSLKNNENAVAELHFAESLAMAQALHSTEKSIKSLKSLAIARAARGFENDKDQTASRFSAGDLVACIVILLLASSLLWLILKHGPEPPKVIETTERWLRKAQTKVAEDPSTQFFSSMLSLFLFAAVAGALFLGLMSTMWLLSYMKERDKASETAISYYNKATSALQEASELQGHPAPVTNADALLLYADFLNRRGLGQRAALVERRAKSLNSSCELPRRPQERQSRP
jgi:hypothetical protein